MCPVGLTGALETKGGIEETGGGIPKAAANSGMAPSGFHSALPSTCVLVRVLTRPSEIHSRSCSGVTGPYSRSSPPMILYIKRACGQNAKNVKLPKARARLLPERAKGL